MRSLRLFASNLALVIFFAGSTPSCARREEPPVPEPAHTTVTMPPEAPAPSVAWKDPPKWARDDGGSPMRKAHYKIRATAGDTDDAEMSVYYFGKGGGGSIDANIDRWKSQFPDATEGDLKRSERKANGMKQTVVEIQGAFQGGGMGPREPEPKKGNYRMIAAIVETPSGNYFFKFTGPEKTVESERTTFFGLLDSVKASDGATPESSAKPTGAVKPAASAKPASSAKPAASASPG